MSEHPVHNPQNPRRTVDGLVFASTRDRHAFQPDLAAMLSFVDVFSARVPRSATIKALRSQEPLKNASGQVVYPAYLYVSRDRPDLPGGLDISSSALHIDGLCLWDRIEAIERPGTFRLGPCFRHRNDPTAKGCELDGTRFVLADVPIRAEWEQWKLLGYPRGKKGYSVMPTDGSPDTYVSVEGILRVGVGVQGGRGTKRPRYSYIPQTSAQGGRNVFEGDLDIKVDVRSDKAETGRAGSRGQSSTPSKRKADGDSAPSARRHRASHSRSPAAPRPAVGGGNHSDPQVPSIRSPAVGVANIRPTGTALPRSPLPSTMPASSSTPHVAAEPTTPAGLSTTPYKAAETATPAAGDATSNSPGFSEKALDPQLAHRHSQDRTSGVIDTEAELKGINDHLRDELAQMRDLVRRLEERQRIMQSGKAPAYTATLHRLPRAGEPPIQDQQHGVGEDVELLRAVYEAQSRENQELKASILRLGQERDTLRDDKRKMKDDREKMKKQVSDARLERDHVMRERNHVQATLFAVREDHQNELKAVHSRTIKSMGELKRQYDIDKEIYVVQARRSADSLRTVEKKLAAVKKEHAATDAMLRTELGNARTRLQEAERRAAENQQPNQMRAKLEEVRREYEGLKTDVGYKKHRIERLEARVHDLAASLGTERVERIKAGRVLGRLAKSLEKGYDDLTGMEEDPGSGEGDIPSEDEAVDDVARAPMSRSQVSARAMARGVQMRSCPSGTGAIAEKSAALDGPRFWMTGSRRFDAHANEGNNGDSMNDNGNDDNDDNDYYDGRSEVEPGPIARTVDALSVGGRGPLGFARA